MTLLRSVGVWSLVLLVVGCGHGAGPLRHRSDGVITIEFTGLPVGQAVSAAFEVCTDARPLEVLGVDPLGVEGGIEMVGAGVWTGAGSDPSHLASAAEFPPEDYGGVLLPGRRAFVSRGCNDESTRSSQILVGVSKTDWAGGNIEGFRVVYRAEDRIRQTDVENFVVTLCGDSGEYCEPEEG